MPTPSSSLSTLRPDLAEFYEFDLEMEKNGFISTKVLAVAETALQSDNPGKIPLEELLKPADTKRTSQGNYNRLTTRFETFAYATEENGIEHPVDERDERRYQHIIQAERVAADVAFATVMRNQEQRVADAVFNATTFASYTTGITNEWDDAANAVPVTDVEAAVQAVYDQSGLWANALVINRKVFRNLRNCESVIDRINSAGAGNPSKPADVTTSMLAAVFDLPYILVAGASKNGAKEGQAASVSQIWSDEYAMVCRIATSENMREPCIGRTFHWGEDGSTIGGTFEEYYSEEARAKIIRVRHDTDEVIMYAQAGHLLSNVTT
jgi:hypothetical protein